MCYVNKQELKSQNDNLQNIQMEVKKIKINQCTI